jgi:hypothetical protein
MRPTVALVLVDARVATRVDAFAWRLRLGLVTLLRNLRPRVVVEIDDRANLIRIAVATTVILDGPISEPVRGTVDLVQVVSHHMNR